MIADGLMNNPRGSAVPPGSPALSTDGDRSDEAYPRQLAETERRAAIRLHAYYRAERRGFAPGHELEDWLAAERQVSEIDSIREQQFRARAHA
jgi:hypothetical protein